MEADSLAGEKADVNRVDAEPMRWDGEESLIREYLAAREPAVFEKIITPHLGWLRRLLYTIFNGNKEDMEDAGQEILLGLLSDIGSFRFRSSFKTFFYQYARHKAIDFLRRLVRLRKRERSDSHAVGNAGEASPEASFLERERKEDIVKNLQRLKPEERTVLLMKDVEGFSLEDIARMTELNIGTVKSRLHRTREKLFGMLEAR